MLMHWNLGHPSAAALPSTQDKRGFAVMKMTDAHYLQMADALNAIKPQLDESAPKYKEQGLSEMRFRWDALRAAKVEGDSTRWICDRLYSYLDDSHIDTALRRYFGHTKT